MSALSDDRPDAIELYASATRASDLGISLELRSDADYLAAAGFVARRGREDRISLMALRMRLTGDCAARGEVVVFLGDLLMREGFRKRLAPMNRARCDAVANAVLGWYMTDNCPVCTGRQYELIPGTSRISTTPCKACQASGRRPLPMTHARTVLHTQWLAAKLERMIDAMKRDLAHWISTRDGPPGAS